MVAILGPFSAHFQTHFQLIFVYLAEKQTKGSEKWCEKCLLWAPWEEKWSKNAFYPSDTPKKMKNEHFLGLFLQKWG